MCVSFKINYASVLLIVDKVTKYTLLFSDLELLTKAVSEIQSNSNIGKYYYNLK